MGSRPTGQMGLPTGTVTFLFTDVEGSSRLWEMAPEAMRQALVRHDALIEQQVTGHGGQVVRPRGEGDSRFAVFTRATDAVAAAIAMQRALVAEAWPEGIDLRVRIALHTGEADLRDGDYYGSAVNRCARLRAIAFGGQILLSQATCNLVLDTLLDGTTLQDLGEQRLRDLAQPERVYQLLAPGLPAGFPPLQGLDPRPHNLPVQTTAFIGREPQLAALRRRVRQPDVRLVTLTGPGGTGKTRLAQQVALDLLDDFPGGVFVVALAHLNDPDLVPSAIARVLGLREEAERPASDLLKDFLRGKRLLLVLDNLEQLPRLAPVVAGLLTSCPSLKILATSRAPLQVYGEREFPVPPLSHPDLDRAQDAHQPPALSALSAQRSALRSSDLAQYEAVRLFVERAQEIDPAFTLTDDNARSVAQLCHRLDGLPLAIELAAARVRLLSPAAMLARLQSAAGPLPLLESRAYGRPERQQTLRAAIAWSYDLLSPDEQALFRRLAVFAGGWTIEAAEVVCGEDEGRRTEDESEARWSVGPSSFVLRPHSILDGLQSLVAKSLVRHDARSASEPRFVMLGTIRDYALEQLAAAGEAEAWRLRHAGYFMTLAEQAAPRLHGAEQAAWLEQLEREHDNFRAALRWLVDHGETERGLRLAAALWLFWDVRGYLHEGREWLAALLPRPLPRPRPRAHTPESLVLPDGLRPTRGLARALTGAGVLAFHEGDDEAARALLETSVALARLLGDRHTLGASLAYLGQVLQERDPAAARQRLEEALAIARDVADQALAARALSNLGEIARCEGDYERAATLYEESLAPARAVGHQWRIAATLHNLGYVALRRGAHDQAASRFAESLRLMQELRTQRGIASCLSGCAGVAAHRGDAQRAARLFGAAEALLAAIGADWDPPDRIEYERNLELARAHLDEAAFEAERAQGRALPSDQAIAYALAV